MGTLTCYHSPDYGGVVHVLCRHRKVFRKNDTIGRSADGFGGTLNVGCVWISAEGVQMRHSPGHVEINDVTCGCRTGTGFQGTYGIVYEGTRHGHQSHAKAGLGGTCDEFSSVKLVECR